MPRMVLALSRDEDQQAALDTLSEAQQTPGSPLFHQWLTPENFGAHFGVSQNDLDRVVTWLKHQGLTIDEVPAGHWMIVFSGTVAQVQLAFQTSIHYYKIGSELHYSNSDDPRLPAALAGLVYGIAGLHDFHPRAAPKVVNARYSPEGVANDGSHFLKPSDFATIYNLNPLYAAGITGKGVDIAVIEPCTMDVSLAQTYWILEGLFSQASNLYSNSGSPVPCTTQEDFNEVALDYEWSGALAPQAKIWLVSSGMPDPLFGAVIGAVNSNFVDVITMSYGSPCISESYDQTWVKLWAAGAHERNHRAGILWRHRGCRLR